MVQPVTLAVTSLLAQRRIHQQVSPPLNLCLADQPQTGFDPRSYSVQLQAKLAALQDLVHTNTSTAA